MKNYLFLIFVLVLAACIQQPQLTSQEYIEPCDYNLMGYQVKDVAYHDSIKSLLSNDPYISIVGESIFNLSEEFGQFLFNGNQFTYKVVGDSLVLINNKQRIACKILDIKPNSFSLEVDNKYFNRIDMVKPVDKRRRIEETVKIEY